MTDAEKARQLRNRIIDTFDENEISMPIALATSGDLFMHYLIEMKIKKDDLINILVMMAVEILP